MNVCSCFLPHYCLLPPQLKPYCRTATHPCTMLHLKGTQKPWHCSLPIRPKSRTKTRFPAVWPWIFPQPSLTLRLTYSFLFFPNSIPSQNSWTPLHRAAMDEKMDIVFALLTERLSTGFDAHATLGKVIHNPSQMYSVYPWIRRYLWNIEPWSKCR